MRVALALAALVAGLALAGCGDDGGETTETETTTTSVESARLRVYFLRDGQVWPVAREVGDVLFDDIAADQLLAGPNADELQLGLETALPDGLEIDVTVEDGVATVELESATELTREALAQIVYTETALPLVESVAIGGETYTRSDFEEQTPSVLVESPLPFEEVTSPITAVGTANTFEANFQYELLDADGDIVDENFVTATSGTGTRGTFEFTTAEFDDVATLVVFESSAEDGSRIHEVEIPLDPAS
ncbi:MAG TPA: Gmad2 immunoglobulin-like domain-containing protein [Gaiellaceae bacterium]|nr:Gmad2 immunoglobulin-like domain-containing protein [Gaiellaceae bacterium]